MNAYEWRVSHFAYEPWPELLDLDPGEYPNGVGLILVVDSTGLIRCTRAGQPEAVLKLSLGGFSDAEEALEAFPVVRPGWPTEWQPSEAEATS